MARSLIPTNGNDNIQTPEYLAETIVNHFKPSGKILEPCCSEGAFLKFLPTADWCELQKGKDFLTYNPEFKYDWIITNPPWSKFRAFLKHSMEISENVVFLSLVNAFFMRARYKDMQQEGFGIKEIAVITKLPPKPWPQMGLLLGATWIQKNYKGDTKISNIL